MTRKRDRRDRSFSLGQAALRFLWGTEVDVPAKRSQLESLLWRREGYSRNGPVEGIAWLLSTKAQAMRNRGGNLSTEEMWEESGEASIMGRGVGRSALHLLSTQTQGEKRLPPH